jgi:hypothetical protein
VRTICRADFAGGGLGPLWQTPFIRTVLQNGTLTKQKEMNKMPSQMKARSFAIRPGRQKSIAKRVTVSTKEVRFKPVKSRLPGSGPGAESQEERIQQAL